MPSHITYLLFVSRTFEFLEMLPCQKLVRFIKLTNLFENKVLAKILGWF